VDIDLLPEKFFCKDNIWTPGKKTCDAPEDKWDMSDAPIKFDTVEDDFEIGGKEQSCKRHFSSLFSRWLHLMTRSLFIISLV